MLVQRAPHIRCLAILSPMCSLLPVASIPLVCQCRHQSNPKGNHARGAHFLSRLLFHPLPPRSSLCSCVCCSPAQAPEQPAALACRWWPSRPSPLHASKPARARSTLTHTPSCPRCWIWSWGTSACHPSRTVSSWAELVYRKTTSGTSACALSSCTILPALGAGPGVDDQMD